MTAPGAAWGLPFAGLLLSIALAPLLAPGVWHRHAGKIALAWSAAFVLPCAATFGLADTLHRLAHVLLVDYLPFVLLLTALFATAGGLRLRGNLPGTPGFNTALLGVGTLLASVMGTTGASMLLIRPLLRANARRHRRAHVVVFFIVLVGNIGGALTPLGDPPLLLGFLRGVGFFWTAEYLAAPTLFLVACLLAAFYAIDRRLDRGEAEPARRPAAHESIAVEGGVNAAILAAIVALVATTALWRPPAGVDVLGLRIGLAQGVRDAGLLGLTLLSLALTPRGLRTANAFSWAPMKEVAAIFAGLFVTLVPVLAMLAAPDGGGFAGIVRAVNGPAGEPRPVAYFWATGLLSAFLDNAPTYLVFFNVAGGDAGRLMEALPRTLAAISAGAVFMGALTYVGNAPNFMIKAIAESQGVRMPGFFGYMAWSGTMLVPLLVVVSAWRFA